MDTRKRKARRPRIGQHNAAPVEIPAAVQRRAKALGLKVVGSVARGGRTHHFRFYVQTVRKPSPPAAPGNSTVTRQPMFHRKPLLVGEWWSGNSRVRVGLVSTHAQSLEDALEVVGKAISNKQVQGQGQQRGQGTAASPAGAAGGRQQKL